jgi:hypothetical protein
MHSSCCHMLALLYAMPARITQFTHLNLPSPKHMLHLAMTGCQLATPPPRLHNMHTPHTKPKTTATCEPRTVVLFGHPLAGALHACLPFVAQCTKMHPCTRMLFTQHCCRASHCSAVTYRLQCCTTSHHTTPQHVTPRHTTPHLTTLT